MLNIEPPPPLLLLRLLTSKYNRLLLKSNQIKSSVNLKGNRTWNPWTVNMFTVTQKLKLYFFGLHLMLTSILFV